jgi:hypothetical protein
MDTPMAVDTRARATGRPRAEVAAERDARVPLRRRMGTAWDVASAALFLASDEAGFVTGVALPWTAAVGAPAGFRNGTRERQLLGSFGPVQVSMPRARMADADGGTREWRSSALPRYARMTRQVEALIAGAYLAGTNTRRVKRALAALFRGAVGKDVVSRTWRKVKVDWEAWNRRDLAGEDVVRFILDGTVVRVRLDRKATNVDGGHRLCRGDAAGARRPGPARAWLPSPAPPRG